MTLSENATQIIEPRAIDRWPRGIAYDKGFSVLGTPLGFGLAQQAGLLFVAHVDQPMPARGSRILVTPFAEAAIGAKKRGLDALVLGYGRKIRLGRMDIRLFPSGLGPGAAQLELSYLDRTIIFCSGVRLTAPLFAPPVELPRCDLLLLDVAPAQPRPPSAKRVSKQLLEWVVGTLEAGRVPVLGCGSVAAAIDATWSLRKLGDELRFCRPLFETIRRIEPVGFTAIRSRRLEQDWPGQAVIVHMAHLWPSSRFARHRDAEPAFVGPGRDLPAWAKTGFRLGEGEDRPGLVSYVQRLGAGQVALGPGCDSTTAQMLGKSGVRVYRVQHPVQMALPLDSPRTARKKSRPQAKPIDNPNGRL